MAIPLHAQIAHFAGPPEGARAATGRAQAVLQLLTHRDAAYLLALRLTGRPSDAEDAVQEAYLRAIRSQAAIPTGEALRKWLLAVVANVVKEWRRGEARRGAREKEVAVSKQEERVGRSGTPSSRTGRAELREEIERALRGLDETARAVLSLHYEQDFSYADAAEILRLRENTLRSHAHRGLQLLRKRLCAAGLSVSPVLLAELLGEGSSLRAPASLTASLARLLGAATPQEVAAGAGALLGTAAARFKLSATLGVILTGGTSLLLVSHLRPAPLGPPGAIGDVSTASAFPGARRRVERRVAAAGRTPRPIRETARNARAAIPPFRTAMAAGARNRNEPVAHGLPARSHRSASRHGRPFSRDPWRLESGEPKGKSASREAERPARELEVDRGSQGMGTAAWKRGAARWHVERPNAAPRAARVPPPVTRAPLFATYRLAEGRAEPGLGARRPARTHRARMRRSRGRDPGTDPLSNQPPVAADDEAWTVEDEPVEIHVLGNDLDPDGDTLTLESVTDGSLGVATIATGGWVRYTPDPDATGQDTFTYTVRDARGAVATATAVVTIAPRAGDLRPAAGGP